MNIISIIKGFAKREQSFAETINLEVASLQCIIDNYNLSFKQVKLINQKLIKLIKQEINHQLLLQMRMGDIFYTRREYKRV